MTEHLKTGPEHLAEFARLAHRAEHNDADTAYSLEERHLFAVLAQANAIAAQTLAFATIVAADTTEPELAAPWLAVFDPTGEIRAAITQREEKREEKRRADFESRYPAPPAPGWMDTAANLADGNPPAGER